VFQTFGDNVIYAFNMNLRDTYHYSFLLCFTKRQSVQQFHADLF
jgi:hypothetical protein